MRPRKLDLYYENILVMLFDKVRQEMEGRFNQFQVAERLKSYFSNPYYHENLQSAIQGDKLIESTATYFGLRNTEAHNIENYIRPATPAAIVQMVKRIKANVKTEPSLSQKNNR